MICLLFLPPVISRAQQTTLTATGDASCPVGTVNYSVGQIAVNNIKSSAGIITEGVQQPYEILFMTGVADKNFTLDYIVYPNPALADVRMKCMRPVTTGMSCTLKDLHGNLISTTEITTPETIIRMQELAAGTYLLSLFENEKLLTTWKVIKY